jgi:1,4-dihydroxy-2-naphthoate octaprenyltransferase
MQGVAIDWLRLLLGQLLVTTIQLTTHYANEYYDYDVDAAIGSARTPFSGGSGILVSGQLDRAVALHATHVCLVFAVVMLIICGLLSPLMWIIGVIALLGGYFYSAPPLKLESSGWGELDTAILTAVLVPLTGYVMQTNRFDPIVLIRCAPFVLIYIAMILTFEFPDYPADKVIGKRTIPVRIGLRRAAWLHNVLLATGVVLLFVIVPAAPLLWLVVPLAAWQIAGVVWRARARSGWRRPALLSGGAVLLAGLLPALWVIELLAFGSIAF